MAGQARDLRVVAGCESPLIITARACPAPPRPTGADSKSSRSSSLGLMDAILALDDRRMQLARLPSSRDTAG